jgi:fatty-acyl-CoA synthase
LSTLHFAYWPKHLPRNLSLPNTSVYHNLEVSALRYPARPVIHYYGRSISYAEFKDAVDRMAGYLETACGVAPGDRVVLYLQNSPQFMIAYFAVLRCDAVVVPVNPMNLTAELRHYFRDSEAHLAVVGQELVPHLRPLLDDGTVTRAVVATYSDFLPDAPRFPVPEAAAAPRVDVGAGALVPWGVAAASAPPTRPHRGDPEDVVVLLYTSGTTGNPKGCVHTNRTTQATAVGAGVTCNAVPDHVFLCAVPMFHVTGMQHCVNMPIWAGASVVVMTRWDRDAAGQLIKHYGVTCWINIPTMVIDLLASPRFAQYDISTLCYIGGGGASMPEAVALRLKELTGLDYLEGYGMSETMSQTHWNPRHRPKPQCCGIPVFDTESRVVDPETLRELAPGETGEIVSSGPQVMREYWRNPQATAEAFVQLDGKRFLRTGDLGRYDEEGYFFMVDRLKRMINAAGFKVWPAEVESAMYRHPDVQEACIIGVPDERKGEAVRAVLVLKPEARGRVTEADVIAWSKQNMAAYKCPSSVQFVDALPKSGTGKIQWRQLQEQARR